MAHIWSQDEAQKMYDALYELAHELDTYDVPQEAACMEIHGDQCSGFCSASNLGHALELLGELDEKG